MATKLVVINTSNYGIPNYTDENIDTLDALFSEGYEAKAVSSHGDKAAYLLHKRESKWQDVSTIMERGTPIHHRLEGYEPVTDAVSTLRVEDVIKRTTEETAHRVLNTPFDDVPMSEKIRTLYEDTPPAYGGMTPLRDKRTPSDYD